MFADRFRKVMDTLDQAAIEDLYATDALLDANVPSWRFQRKGGRGDHAAVRTVVPARGHRCGAP
jgi:hypothetical protein